MVILFDIDGTLIDHDTAETVAVAALHRRVSNREDGVSFYRRWRSAFDRYYARYLAGELSLQQQRRARFREVVDPELSDHAADQMSDAYIDDYLTACRLYPDVSPALAQLTLHAMGIISNGERSQQQSKLSRAGIARYFGPLIVSSECGMAKPSRGIFELACAAMGVVPFQAIYIGDRLDIDAEGAQAAGLHGIWLDRRGVGSDGNNRMRIESLAALPEAVALIAQTRGNAAQR